MRPRSQRGITKVEVLLAMFVLIVLFLILAPGSLNNTLHKGAKVQTLSNMKQLYLATQQMALERTTDGGLRDVICPNGVPITFAQWTNQLIDGGYLSANDMAKLKATPGAVEDINAFAVARGDTNTLFLATKNWHGIDSKELSGEPYGTKGFVVFRTSGDGAVLTARAINDTNAIGGGGRFNYLPLK